VGQVERLTRNILQDRNWGNIEDRREELGQDRGQEGRSWGKIKDRRAGVGER
jgi:hypothetical protein